MDWCHRDQERKMVDARGRLHTDLARDPTRGEKKGIKDNSLVSALNSGTDPGAQP